MPELPEVETIARRLREGDGNSVSLIGKQISSAEVYWERTLQMPDTQTFLQRIPGQTVESIGRRGKFLVFKLSLDYLLIHLRMSGDLRVETSITGESTHMRKHDRAAFLFQEGYRLVFEDARKFGRIWLPQNPLEVLGDLGPEPLDPEFSAEDLLGKLRAYRRQIKPLLLDQTFLAGLGNIYTDEALHQAKLHPLTSAHMITPEQADRLYAAIRNVLQVGIEKNGASLDWVYRGGGYQNVFQVYGRTGEVCYTCGHLIQRILVGQRGTHYCPYCQPLQAP